MMLLLPCIGTLLGLGILEILAHRSNLFHQSTGTLLRRAVDQVHRRLPVPYQTTNSLLRTLDRAQRQGRDLKWALDALLEVWELRWEIQAECHRIAWAFALKYLGTTIVFLAGHWAGQTLLGWSQEPWAGGPCDGLLLVAGMLGLSNLGAIGVLAAPPDNRSGNIHGAMEKWLCVAFSLSTGDVGGRGPDMDASLLPALDQLRRLELRLGVSMEDARRHSLRNALKCAVVASTAGRRRRLETLVPWAELLGLSVSGVAILGAPFWQGGFA